jgi:hypothetical protein
MKNKIVSFLICFNFLSGCNEPKKETIVKNVVKVSVNKNLPHLADNIKLKDEKIQIYKDEDFDSLVFSRDELNKIEILFPILKTEFPSSPEESYAGNSWRSYINQDGKEETITFGSEAGEDQFCLLYAYYLKQKNGEKKFESERKNLIKLYRTINEFYGDLNYGGTFFGHQYKRLCGYAEYSIYLLSVNRERYDKKYDFKKQKTLFIESLIQYLNDEESKNVYNFEDLVSNKAKANSRRKQFQEQINVLEKLITNYFYLNQIQKFEATYYK